MLLCHCHRVNERALEAVLAAGASKVGHLVRATRAGTDCGSCLPALRAACHRLMAEPNECAPCSSTAGPTTRWHDQRPRRRNQPLEESRAR